MLYFTIVVDAFVFTASPQIAVEVSVARVSFVQLYERGCAKIPFRDDFGVEFHSCVGC